MAVHSSRDRLTDKGKGVSVMVGEVSFRPLSMYAEFPDEMGSYPDPDLKGFMGASGASLYKKTTLIINKSDKGGEVMDLDHYVTEGMVHLADKVKYVNDPCSRGDDCN